MSFEITEHVLSAAVADDATATISYPSGTNRGDFFGAFDHRAVIDQRELVAPRDFTLAFNTGDITFTNKTGATLASGTVIGLQLDRIGRNAGRVRIQGKEVPGAVEIPFLYLNLGAPVVADTDGLVESVTPASEAARTLTLIANDLDVPRNVTVTSAADETGRTFTVTGKDVYGADMVEEITGANAGTAAGKKAFAEVTSIVVDDNTAGAIECGWGVVLGVPVFLPNAEFLESELINGAAAEAGTFVAAVTDHPTATTGDVRGTYSPDSAPDGSRTFALIVRHPEPGYAGAPQYAG